MHMYMYLYEELYMYMSSVDLTFQTGREGQGGGEGSVDGPSSFECEVMWPHPHRSGQPARTPGVYWGGGERGRGEGEEREGGGERGRREWEGEGREGGKGEREGYHDKAVYV